VRIQVWSAISAFLLVSIARRRLRLPHTLWEVLQFVSIASMEQIPISELLKSIDTKENHVDIHNQLEINYS
jgi:branched-subunit amino acid transport protein